ncbi:MAG: divergent PAP2 family protein [Candidatus Margulisiibacteriota bacterium]
MQIVAELLKNFPLVSSVSAMVLGQAFKIVYYYFIDRKIDIKHFFEAGGMPSAHSAMVSALVFSVGMRSGWSSPALAIAFAFACIVIYDAVGVRRATGKQSMLIKRILDDMNKTDRISGENLHEFMGHTPLEVTVGIVFGIFVAVCLYLGVYRFVY